MRVTHVITRLIVGGAQENTIASVLGLNRKPGVQVNLIAGPTVGPEGSLEPAFHEQPELLTILPSLIRPLNPWQDVRALNQLTEIFRAQAPQIVHTHSGKAGILGRLAARRAKVPHVLHTIHGPSFGDFQGMLPNLLFRAAEQYAGRCTTHFVSVAEAMTRQYLAAGIGRPEQFTRIYSGFPLEPFLNVGSNVAGRARLGLQPEDFVVGKIARLVPLKGHEELVACAQRLLPHIPKLKFLLVGDGPLKPAIQSQIEALGLQRQFVFSGLVSPAEVPSLIGVMDVLVHLSRREGLPRALPQALAAGRPVVAWHCDGAGEVCLSGETGFLLKPGDVEGLVQAVQRLASDPGLRKRLGAQGRELVRERFPVARMVDELYNLYQRLLRP